MKSIFAYLFTLLTFLGHSQSLVLRSSVRSSRNVNIKMSGEINSKPVSSSNVKNTLLKVTEGTTKIALSLLASSSVASFPSKAFAKDNLVWEKVSLPVRETLFDISFDPMKPLHGWVVGSKGTFLETFDGKVNFILRHVKQFYLICLEYGEQEETLGKLEPFRILMRMKKSLTVSRSLLLVKMKDGLLVCFKFDAYFL